MLLHQIHPLWKCDKCETLQKTKKGIFKTSSFDIKGSDVQESLEAKFICNSCMLSSFPDGNQCSNCQIYSTVSVQIIKNRQMIRLGDNSTMWIGLGIIPQLQVLNQYLKLGIDSKNYYRFSPEQFKFSDFSPLKGLHDHLPNLSYLCLECFEQLLIQKCVKLSFEKRGMFDGVCDICAIESSCETTTIDRDKRISCGYGSHHDGDYFSFTAGSKPKEWKNAKHICDTCLDLALENNIVYHDGSYM